MSGKDYRIAVLASGGGTTFKAAYEQTQGGHLADTEIALVICNNGPKNPDAGVWERADRLGVDIVHISNLTQETCSVPIIGGEPVKGTISFEASEAILKLAKERDINMIVGLGFMKRLIGPVLEMPDANIHHGPLPATAGKWGPGIDEEVMRQGLASSGTTMHWMDKRVDEHGLPMYDLDENNLDLLIGHESFPVTDAMRREWRRLRTAKILQKEAMRVEKLWVGPWIHQALEQL